ncbi:hypothetical protein V6N13_125076 [Hibiscus sabdariffa]
MIYPCASISKDIDPEKDVPFEKRDKKKAQTRLGKLESHEEFNASVEMIVEWEFINHVSPLSDLDISVTQLASREEALR